MEKIFPLFATNANDTGGKFTAVVVATGAVSPLAHLGLRISPRIFEKIRNSRFDTQGLGGNYSCKKPKIPNDPHVILGVWGKMMHEKTPEAKYLVTLSL